MDILRTQHRSRLNPLHKRQFKKVKHYSIGLDLDKRQKGYDILKYKGCPK